MNKVIAMHSFAIKKYRKFVLWRKINIDWKIATLKDIEGVVNWEPAALDNNHHLAEKVEAEKDAEGEWEERPI